MNILNNLKYTKTHEWVEFTEEKQAKVGLTDFAQSKMGSLVFVNLPMEGDEMAIGVSFGDVESVKAVSDINSPVSGVISSVNEVLLDAPETINEDPYGAWLVMVSDVFETEELLDAKEYEAFCNEEE